MENFQGSARWQLQLSAEKTCFRKSRLQTRRQAVAERYFFSSEHVKVFFFIARIYSEALVCEIVACLLCCFKQAVETFFI